MFAAAVILPALFDGQGSYEPPFESRIPEPTPFPVPPALTPERPVIVADTPEIRTVESSTSEAAQASTAEVVGTAPAPEPEPEPVLEAAVEVEAPRLDPVGLPEGWSVRLASFSDAANASNLLDILQSSGHRAYTRTISSSQGPLTAVYVGPSVDRAAVEQLRLQLQAETQLSGMIVPYEIEQL